MTDRQRGLLVSFVSFSLLLFSFQNCGKVANPLAFTGSTSAQESVPQSEGNGGQPYDGKIFVLLGDICPDKSSVHTRIAMKSTVEAQLVRDNCQDISPVTLSSQDFQIDPTDANKIIFRSQTLPHEGLVDVARVNTVIGFSYYIAGDFDGATADSSANYTASTLRLFENGIEIGPAHSWHADIETYGLGRFSHWLSASGTVDLVFSSSDNSDPRTNGRKYTYVIAP